VQAGNAFVAKFGREPVSASDCAWLNGYAAAVETKAEPALDPRMIEACKALQAILDSACSAPAPYHGHAMDPVNDLRLVSGRRIDAARTFLAQCNAVKTNGDVDDTPDHLRKQGYRSGKSP
jgi:hypothetical protein